MEFKEALKLVQSKKIKENFLLIEMYYDRKILLPYKEGMAFIASLANAEQYKDTYGKPRCIIELDKECFKVTPLSALEYEQIKIATLLNVSVEDVQEHYKEAT